MIKLPKNVITEEVSVERKYRSATAGLTRRIKLIYAGIYERFGEEGLNLIRDISDRYGLELLERAQKKVEWNNVKSIGLYLVRIFNTIEGNGEVTEFTDDRVVIKVNQCPYLFEDMKMCEAHTTMEKVLAENLGENLCYHIPKSIPKGNSYCEHVIERKKK